MIVPCVAFSAVEIDMVLGVLEQEQEDWVEQQQLEDPLQMTHRRGWVMEGNAGLKSACAAATKRAAIGKTLRIHAMAATWLWPPPRIRTRASSPVLGRSAARYPLCGPPTLPTCRADPSTPLWMEDPAAAGWRTASQAIREPATWEPSPGPYSATSGGE